MSHDQPVHALPWVGGQRDKQRPSRTVRVQPAALPQSIRRAFRGNAPACYCNGQPSHIEIVGDTNGESRELVDVVRDQRDELEELILATPVWSAVLHKQAVQEARRRRGESSTKGILCGPSALSGAHVAGSHKTGMRNWHPKKRSWRSILTLPDKLSTLTDRLRGVAIEHRDAIYMLDRLADEQMRSSTATRPTTSDMSYTSIYSFDRDEFTVAVEAQEGLVAISGYADEWITSAGGKRPLKPSQLPGTSFDTRTEVLWTNYDPEGRLF